MKPTPRTRGQIEDVLNRQSPRPKVLSEGPKWKLQLRDRVIEVNEIVERAPTKAGAKEPGHEDAPSPTKAGAPQNEHSQKTGHVPENNVENPPEITSRSAERMKSLPTAQREQIDGIFKKAEPGTGQLQMLERAFAAGHSAPELESLRAAMIGKSGPELEKMFSGIGVVQLYQQSCVPTSYQIAIADVDPYFAFQLRNHPEMMMNEQQDALRANGAAQTKRIDLHGGKEHLEGHLNDPEMRRKLEDPKSYNEHGDKGGIEATQMAGSALHKQLEQATGSKYEIITATRKSFGTKGHGQFDHTAMPYERIDAALDAAKPVLISTDRLGTHAQVIKSRTVAPDGKVIYTVIDPATGKASHLEAAALGWMGTFSLTLPAETAGTRVAVAEPEGRTPAGPHHETDTNTRTGSSDEKNEAKEPLKQPNTPAGTAHPGTAMSPEEWAAIVEDRLKGNPDALRKYQGMKKSMSPRELMERYSGDPNAAVKNYTEMAADQAAKDSVREANRAKSKQLATKLKADLEHLMQGEPLPDGTVRRTPVAAEIEEIIRGLDEADPAKRIKPSAAVERIRTLVIEQHEVARNAKQFPGAEVLTGVNVYARTDISVEEFNKMPNAKKQGMERKTVDGVPGVYKKVTDIDLLVVNGGKAQKMEQIKTGENDKPGAAGLQNKSVTDAIESARAKGQKLIFETQDRTDVSAKIDVNSISQNLGVTVGPANAGFDESLDYVASDLARTIKEFVDERGVAPQQPQPHPHKGGGK